VTTKVRNIWDWRNTDTGWPYKEDALKDPNWIKDRDKLFREGGNGWWMLKGTPQYNKHLKKIKEQLNDRNQ
jgi:hypothetical protein|tara:strand:- start:990 stop:1202 length:213 start_codon:yes stop_codon:yes gene_type:complete